ncbi:MAG: ATP-dependent DNA ligase [Verrucomicrobia bacterium]|nr:MAG: ATP-dependent DNA ligase [Verrucomicrobiota bacterium]
MSLEEYRRKRNFKITREPKAPVQKKARRRFVIQKHAATHLHYDLRLEVGGKLKSWACPKGIPYRRGEKHLAVKVEDHPSAYADFEGTIPKGQYGGGTVMIWDKGCYESISPLKDLEKGKFHFLLHGKKVNGEWYLVHFRKGDNEWLLIKAGQSMKAVGRKLDDLSVVSSRTIKQIAAASGSFHPFPLEASQDGQPLRKIYKKKSNKKRQGCPAFVPPMKAKLKKAPPPRDGWFYEIKFDGWRTLALKGGSEVRLVSGNGNDLSDKFPEIVTAVAQIQAQDAVLDGEMVALNKKGVSSFQLLQAYALREKRPPIFFYVFDLLQLNGVDLKNHPIEERKSHLAKLKLPAEIRLSSSLGVEAELLLRKMRRLRMEGLIGKKSKSLYESGIRSGAWIKLKLGQEQEFVIGGYTLPQGSRSFLGSVMVGYYEGKKLIFAGKVGAGFNSRMLHSLYQRLLAITQSKCPFFYLTTERKRSLTSKELESSRWVKPRLVCQVRFREWTDGGRLRQPVFLGLREDQDASEVTLEKVDGQ